MSPIVLIATDGSACESSKLDLRFPKVHYLGLDEALVLFERAMLEQTDLQVEAAQSRRFAQNFAHHAYIRTPATLFAGPDLLVMEYVQG